MLMRASPVQGVVVVPEQPQPASSVMSTGSTFTADKDTKLRAISADTTGADADGDLLSTPKPLNPQPFDSEDFEPNPVYNPAAQPVSSSAVAAASVPPPPLLRPPLPNYHTSFQYPPDQPTSSTSYSHPPVPGSISFSVPQHQQPPAPAPSMDRRKQFLVFVKILLKHLEKNDENRIRLHAKRVLTECIAKNRQGDPEYTPLHLAAEARILPIVGPRHWNRCVQYLNLHLKKEFQKRQQQPQQQQGQQPLETVVSVAI